MIILPVSGDVPCVMTFCTRAACRGGYFPTIDALNFLTLARALERRRKRAHHGSGGRIYRSTVATRLKTRRLNLGHQIFPVNVFTGTGTGTAYAMCVGHDRKQGPEITRRVASREENPHVDHLIFSSHDMSTPKLLGTLRMRASEMTCVRIPDWLPPCTTTRMHFLTSTFSHLT